MRQFLMVFYVIFFATGFMGGTALLLLNVRLGGSRLLRPFLLFQVLLLTGMGLILLYFSLPVPPSHSSTPLQVVLLSAINAVNAAVWVVVIFLVRRAVPRSESGSRGSRLPDFAKTLAGLVALKSIANVLVVIALPAAAVSGSWNLGGHILSAAAMAAFGSVLYGSAVHPESPQLSPLLRAYGILAIVFAPIGLIEYAVEAAQISWLGTISLDHFFYLAWNVVSMSVSLRLFGTAGAIPVDVEASPDETAGAIPVGERASREERSGAFGLSGREVEIAALIARGLTNKEIAAELYISSGTVRTHIYNLYRKVGAGNRVELVNILRE